MRNFGKPIIADDWSTIEYEKRPKDWEPPPPIEGYVRDSANPWKFRSLWVECSMRDRRHQIRSCGRLVIAYLCRCADCPMLNKVVRAKDCKICTHRK